MDRKAVNPIDKHVGSRVRMRRMMLSMSQEKLGGALGLTFQQVQKYEKGTNRIGASRIQHLSQILQVPVAFFFDGAPRPQDDQAINDVGAFVTDFLATSNGLALMTAFAKINNKKIQHSILQMIEEIAADQ